MSGKVIGIDGPAGSGKSSTARAVAKELGLAYLDTGSMYRAATLSCILSGVNLDSPAEILAHIESKFVKDFQVILDPNDPYVALASKNVTTDIRNKAVTARVTLISSNQDVRDVLIKLQQRIIAREANDSESFSKGRGIVVEGRDITTVVAPDADFRLLVTANAAVRQERRREETGSGAADNVELRDEKDSRTTSFIEPAPGVILVDNTKLNLKETTEKVLDVVRY